MTGDLLHEARRLLTGDLTAGPHSLRAACWLARRALEERVVELLRAGGLDPGEGSMRSRLVCLEVAYRDRDPHLVAGAHYAWAGLSQASHHHAFELSPSLTEVTHLVDLVAAIEDGAGGTRTPSRARATPEAASSPDTDARTS